jgi:hypothetical protein
MWQGLQGLHMLLGKGGVLSVADHAIEADKHPPACGERGVQVDRSQKAVDGARSVPFTHVTQAPFLMHATEAGLQSFQAAEERFGPI